MQIDAVHDSVSVHVGETFSATDVASLQDALVALGPFSQLNIDFAEARQCDDAALARLAASLLSLDHGAVRLHGLSARQWRVLTYMGLEFNRV